MTPDDDGLSLAQLKRMTKWKAKRLRSPVSAADMRAELERDILKPLDVLAKVGKAWRENAPRQLVTNARPVALGRSVLTIAASSSTARAALLAALRGGLERTLKAADTSVSRIKVVTDATGAGNGY